MNVCSSPVRKTGVYGSGLALHYLYKSGGFNAYGNLVPGPTDATWSRNTYLLINLNSFFYGIIHKLLNFQILLPSPGASHLHSRYRSTRFCRLRQETDKRTLHTINLRVVLLPSGSAGAEAGVWKGWEVELNNDRLGLTLKDQR